MPIVVLDPGHGGNDPGAQSNGIIEKDLALNIGLKVRDWLLNCYDADVRMTRETDTFVSLSDRASFANQLNADYFVSLHHNAGGGEGFESFVYSGTRSGKSGQMQDFVHAEVMAYLGPLGVKDRGKKEANFAVLRETKMSAILLENLFVDNVMDATLLKDSELIKELARAIARGIGNAMGLVELYPPGTPDWKKDAVGWLYAQGHLTDPSWKQKIEQPLPLWAEAVILQKLYRKLEGS
ncbi:N-acetylmuramoyl-L-alanine amidase [Paenibacillus alkalitolerans]|uniref:N-acetylmuramoyl-L-alanine amidase n=1 Tax=Paenibacillus alkalitolerans TaxID=2799335 RepID=UPI0018F5474D|nr:N-acetylmuramoyl-L-alanine amidase [Paenibacillus alkalitolerans]